MRAILLLNPSSLVLSRHKLCSWFFLPRVFLMVVNKAEVGAGLVGQGGPW